MKTRRNNEIAPIKPQDFFNNADLGKGGYAKAPAKDAKKAVKKIIKQKRQKYSQEGKKVIAYDLAKEPDKTIYYQINDNGIKELSEQEIQSGKELMTAMNKSWDNLWGSMLGIWV